MHLLHDICKLYLQLNTSTKQLVHHKIIQQFHFKHSFFKNSFFPAVIIEWNNLDISVRNSKSQSTFEKDILQFIRLSPSSTYNCFNNKGIKHITRLRLGLSHLCDHKFKHGFLDSLNPICSCGLDVETTCHYLLHCPNFTNERSILLNIVSTINESSLTSCDASIVKLLLNGDESLDLETNTLILNATVDFILSSGRFDGPLI